MARRIHMGTLARPHGIKGEICVDWYADSPSLLDGPFWLQAATGNAVRIVSLMWASHIEQAMPETLTVVWIIFVPPVPGIFHAPFFGTPL